VKRERVHEYSRETTNYKFITQPTGLTCKLSDVQQVKLILIVQLATTTTTTPMMDTITMMQQRQKSAVKCRKQQTVKKLI